MHHCALCRHSHCSNELWSNHPTVIIKFLKGFWGFTGPPLAAPKNHYIWVDHVKHTPALYIYRQTALCGTVHSHIPYGRKFWRGIYFGGLAVLRAIRQYFIRQKLQCDVIIMAKTGSTAKVNSVKWHIFSNPPKYLPAKISGHTVYIIQIHH